ncbi:hypothetical protein ACFW9F_27520 [Streptomyces sp. NPDC059506]|uniref:hypothetical protein n=1 Tax=unclassified Streptomyces TaxID=2593676 RepID=UPI000CC110B2|nr:hypothetical protein [Streptomyces sp. SCUT-3]PLW74161.1 hypothetical protein C0036_03405 [Streptomyces sp. DJ]QMV23061.1 hypothetical protein GQS52_16220 [Streptomyces sp. SCUT-3]
MNGRRNHGRSGAAARTALLCCLLAAVSLFCCSWASTGSAPSPDAIAADRTGTADRAGTADRDGRPVHGPESHRDRPAGDHGPADADRDGSTCHGEKHRTVQVLLPPAPAVQAVTAPSPATDRTAGGEGIRGPSHDAAPSVDLHRLQVQRT